MPVKEFDSSRSHDYSELVRRWRAVAKQLGRRLVCWAVHDEERLYVLQSRPWRQGGFYLSAGIHGDEPASVWGLLEWAEKNITWLRDHDFMLFPCLNPWGLQQNSRGDAKGRDLNRQFHRPHSSPIGAWKKLVHGKRFSAALCLHEDYDAQGLYLYELCRETAHRGEIIMQRAGKILAPDRRTQIEGFPASGGILRRAVDDAELRSWPEWPEAIYLYLEHTDWTVTFETPSERDIERRVAAQVAFLEAALL